MAHMQQRSCEFALSPQAAMYSTRAQARSTLCVSICVCICNPRTQQSEPYPFTCTCTNAPASPTSFSSARSHVERICALYLVLIFFRYAA